MPVVCVKYVRCEYLDISTGVTWYGIKGKTANGSWYYICESKKALVYAFEHERDAKLKELRKRRKAVSDE